MLVSPRITLGSYELMRFPSMAPPDIPPPASWKWKIPVAPRSPNKTTKAMSVEAPGGWVDDVHRKTLKHENVWKDFLLVYMAHMVTYDKFSGSFFHDKFHRLRWRLLWNCVNVSIMVAGCKLYCGMGWVLLRFFFRDEMSRRLHLWNEVIHLDFPVLKVVDLYFFLLTVYRDLHVPNRWLLCSSSWQQNTIK